MSTDVLDHMRRIVNRTRAPLERLIRERGLTMAQGFAIGYIEANQERGVTAAELAEVTHTARPSVSSLIAGLERGGFVERHPDPTDARSKLIRVLPPGRGLTADFAPHVEEFEKKMLAPLSEEERNQLIDLLSRIDSHLDSFDSH